MRIRCLHHSRLGGEIHLPDWAKRRGHDWSSLVVPDADELPRPADLDCLVVMGGPMSVWEAERHPWLSDEKRLIESLIESGKPVLGICLGAQLLAAVLGAHVYRGGQQEVGWFPVRSVPEARQDPVGRVLPDRFETFLWHGDTFGIPDGAVRIAGSDAYQNQGFRSGGILALQFHLEVRPDWVRRIAARDASQLATSRYVQTVDTILGKPEAIYRDNNALMDRLLDRWLEEIDTGR